MTQKALWDDWERFPHIFEKNVEMKIFKIFDQKSKNLEKYVFLEGEIKNLTEHSRLKNKCKAKSPEKCTRDSP